MAASKSPQWMGRERLVCSHTGQMEPARAQLFPGRAPSPAGWAGPGRQLVVSSNSGALLASLQCGATGRTPFSPTVWVPSIPRPPPAQSFTDSLRCTHPAGQPLISPAPLSSACPLLVAIAQGSVLFFSPSTRCPISSWPDFHSVVIRGAAVPGFSPGSIAS